MADQKYFLRREKTDSIYFRRHQDELGNTKAVITPVCILVDRSGSMNMQKFVDEYGKTRMERLNEGIAQFIEEIRNDDMLADSVEVSILGFLDDLDDDPENPPVEEILKFSTIDNIGEITITAKHRSGDTPLGVNKALEILENEKKFLKENKSKYNQPWLVIFSDGRATPSRKWNKPDGGKDFSDINNRLRKAQKRTRELESNKKLTVIPVLISEPFDGEFDEGYKQMKGFSSSNRALVLCNDERYNPEGLTFKDFFKILGRSVSVSNADLIFNNSNNNDTTDRPRTIFEETEQVDHEEVATYINESNNGLSNNSLNQVQLTISLPYELYGTEVVRVSYCPFGSITNQWHEYYSDETPFLEINSKTSVLTLELDSGVTKIDISIDVCTSNNHEFKERLVNDVFDITNGGIYIDLSSSSQKYQDQVAKLKEEAKQVSLTLKEETQQEDEFEEEDIKPIQKVKTKETISTTDDEYLKNLSVDFDDWDNI